MIVQCDVCKKDTDKRPYYLKKHNYHAYCSYDCFVIKQRERFPAVMKQCILCDKDFKAYPSDKKYNRANFCGRECKVKWLRGENHFRFKNASSENEKIRKSAEYRKWRTAVFIRDNRQCIWCSSRKNIEADHIKPFSLFPELALDLSNGRTLCHKCHETTESYMNPYMKKEDFLEAK